MAFFAIAIVGGLIAIPLLLAAALVIWPYRLGKHVVEQSGGGAGAQVFAAWSFEVIYLVALLVVGFTALYRMGLRIQAADTFEKATARVKELASEVEQLETQADSLDAAASTLAGFAEMMRAEPAGLEASQVADLESLCASGFELPPGERLLGALEAGLSMPRVAHRNGPRIQTTVAHGLCVVTDKHVRFVSSQRLEAWRVDAITAVIREGARVLLPVTTRRTVFGLDASDAPVDAAVDLVVALVSWARGLPAAPVQETAHLDRLRERYRSEADGFDARRRGVELELAAARAELAALASRPVGIPGRQAR